MKNIPLALFILCCLVPAKHLSAEPDIPIDIKRMLSEIPGNLDAEAYAKELQAAGNLSPLSLLFFVMSTNATNVERANGNAVLPAYLAISSNREKEEMLDFLQQKILQPKMLNNPQKSNFFHLILNSNDREANLDLIKKHIGGLGSSDWIPVSRWILKQDPAWLQRNDVRKMIGSLVERIKPALYENPFDTTIWYITMFIDRFPFSEKEFAPAVVDALMVRVEHPKLGDMSSAFRSISKRYENCSPLINERLKTAIEEGSLNRTKLILWQVFGRGFPEEDRAKLVEIAAIKNPEIEGFIKLLRNTGNLSPDSVSGADEALAKELLQAEEAERAQNTGDPLVNEFLLKGRSR